MKNPDRIAKVTIGFRATREMRTELKSAAQAADMPLSQWIARQLRAVLDRRSRKKQI
jgi:hypothetical protein